MAHSCVDARMCEPWPEKPKQMAPVVLEAGVQAHPQKFDLLKIRAKSVEIWTKCVKTFAKSLVWRSVDGATCK